MKVLHPKLSCPECDSEEFVLDVLETQSFKIVTNEKDDKAPYYNKGELSTREEKPEEIIKCAECGSDIEAPIDFFCPHCFDSSPIMGQSGTVERGEALYGVGCLNALRAELQYLKGAWNGRILRTNDAAWLPYWKVRAEERNMTREEILSYMLPIASGNRLYTDEIVMGVGTREPWAKRQHDGNILPIYGVFTDKGWYFINSADPNSPPFQLPEWQIVCNWVYKVPNIVVED